MNGNKESLLVLNGSLLVAYFVPDSLARETISLRNRSIHRPLLHAYMFLGVEL